jgi:hypothetical protein
LASVRPYSRNLSSKAQLGLSQWGPRESLRRRVMFGRERMNKMEAHVL